MRVDDALETARRRLAGAGIEFLTDVASGPFTTYRVGGPLAILVEVDDVASLVALAAALEGTGAPTLVVGNGSNLLVADAGASVVAVRLTGDFEAVDIDGATVRAGGAARLPVVARRTVAADLAGFEWAVGVPGTIGGAVRMNAGGHGSDMAAVVSTVRVLDLATGHDVSMSLAECRFEYRSSAISSTMVVVDATLELHAAPDDHGGDAMLSDIVQWRRANQPGGQNAGSVFTNPAGDSAGRLIDAAGLKGHRVGSAAVSTKHANFIQADPDGSADDVAALMASIADTVRATSGIDLHAETVMIGFDDEVLQRAGARR